MAKYGSGDYQRKLSFLAVSADGGLRNSEFMFWGCFTYDVTGPCHIWKPETIPEKKAATVYLDALNTELEPHKKLD